METLTAGRAAFHFRNAGKAPGFLWQFSLTLGLASLLLQALSLWIIAPAYAVYLEALLAGTTPDVLSEDVMAASNRANLISLLTLPITLALWSLFEAASQRRYMRGENFRLRIGADEGRMAVVGLIWAVLLIGVYIALVVAAAVLIIPFAFMGGETGGLIGGVIAIFAIIPALLWIFARFSPASALTIRDRQLRFFEAWGVSRGRTGQLMLAYLIIILLFSVISVIIYGFIAALGFGLLLPVMSDNPGDPAALLASLGQPAFWGPMLVALLVIQVVSAGFMHIMGGPGALAARTDPNWAGREDVATTFV